MLRVRSAGLKENNKTLKWSVQQKKSDASLRWEQCSLERKRETVFPCFPSMRTSEQGPRDLNEWFWEHESPFISLSLSTSKGLLTLTVKISDFCCKSQSWRCNNVEQNWTSCKCSINQTMQWSSKSFLCKFEICFTLQVTDIYTSIQASTVFSTVL